MKSPIPFCAGVFAIALLAAGPAFAQSQGVSSDEILIGTLQDLSGPLAGYGKDLRNGMQMRIAEANDKGGLHGRKLKLLVEDTGYDPRRAVLGARLRSALMALPVRSRARSSRT